MKQRVSGVGSLTHPQADNDIFIPHITDIEVVAAIARKPRMGDKVKPYL
jgi:hypothetical protein